MGLIGIICFPNGTYFTQENDNWYFQLDMTLCRAVD